MRERLLTLLAERGDDDVDIVGLALKLRPTQAQVITQIAALIGEGRIDAVSLRPLPMNEPEAGALATSSKPAAEPTDESVAPVFEPTAEPVRVRCGQSRNGSASMPLFEALKAEAERRGMSLQKVSFELFNNKARIFTLKHRETVRKTTADRILAWIAAAPAAPPPAVTPEPSLPDSPVLSSFELHRDIQAFLDRTGISASAFGIAVNNDAALVKGIRSGRQPRKKTLAKLHAIIADPPEALLNTRYRLSRASVPPPKRDPTRPPLTAPLDADERQKQAAARRAKASRKGLREVAEKRIDAGLGMPPPGALRSAHLDVERVRAEEARQADPVEQAKLALQRKGLVVHSASVTGGRKDRFIVSGQPRELTPAELLDLAEKKTGQSFRRAAA